MQPHRFSEAGGFSLLEMIIVISLLGIVSGFAVLSLERMINPAESGAATAAHFMKEVRARAMSTTFSYRIRASDTRTIIAEFASSCDSASFTADEELILLLPDEVTMTDLSWSVCFSQRGFAEASESIPLEDLYGTEHTVQVFLGGAVRVS